MKYIYCDNYRSIHCILLTNELYRNDLIKVE